jgi:hypothetical protein
VALGEHHGGYDDFSFDITAHLKPTTSSSGPSDANVLQVGVLNDAWFHGKQFNKHFLAPVQPHENTHCLFGAQQLLSIMWHTMICQDRLGTNASECDKSTALAGRHRVLIVVRDLADRLAGDPGI